MSSPPLVGLTTPSGTEQQKSKGPSSTGHSMSTPPLTGLTSSSGTERQSSKGPSSTGHSMSSPHLAGLSATSETKTPGTEKVGELYVPDKSQMERFAAARDAVGGDDPWRNFEGPQVAPPWQEPRSMADAMSGLDAMRDLRWWTDFAGRLNLAKAATEMPEALKSYLKWGVENLDYPPAFGQEIPQLVDMVRSGLHTAKVVPSYFPDVSVPDAKHPTPMESLDYLANVLVPGYSLGTQWENMTSMERGVHIAADSLLTFILLRFGVSLAKGAQGGSGKGQLVKQTTPSLISRQSRVNEMRARVKAAQSHGRGALGQPAPRPRVTGRALGHQGPGLISKPHRPGALGEPPITQASRRAHAAAAEMRVKAAQSHGRGALGQPAPRPRVTGRALGHQGPGLISKPHRPGHLRRAGRSPLPGGPRGEPPASDSGPRVTQERLAWEERVRQRAAAEEEMLRRPGGLAEYQKLHQSREAQRLLDIREDAIRKRLEESTSRATAVLDNPSMVPELSGPGAVKDAELLLQELSKQRGIQAAEQVLKDLAKQRAAEQASRRAHMAGMQAQSRAESARGISSRGEGKPKPGLADTPRTPTVLGPTSISHQNRTLGRSSPKPKAATGETIVSRVPGSGVRGRGSGERETTASSLAGKQQAREKEDNGGQGKDGPAEAIAQGGNGR